MVEPTGPDPDGRAGHSGPLVRRDRAGSPATSVTGQVPAVPLGARFEFDGGAATYLATVIGGYRLRFTGRAAGLFGQWIIWLLLMVVTLGVYGLWVVPRLTRWTVRHQEFDTRAVRRA